MHCLYLFDTCEISASLDSSIPPIKFLISQSRRMLILSLHLAHSTTSYSCRTLFSHSSESSLIFISTTATATTAEQQPEFSTPSQFFYHSRNHYQKMTTVCEHATSDRGSSSRVSSVSKPRSQCQSGSKPHQTRCSCRVSQPLSSSSTSDSV